MPYNPHFILCHCRKEWKHTSTGSATEKGLDKTIPHRALPEGWNF